jgi:hypothetical protein
MTKQTGLYGRSVFSIRGGTTDQQDSEFSELDSLVGTFYYSPRLKNMGIERRHNNMKKRLMTGLLASIMVVGLTAAAYAAAPIKLFYNGEEIQTSTSPVNINGRIYAPVRALAEAMGSMVSWDPESNQVNVTGNDQSMQIANLERALAPRSVLDAVSSWAMGVQSRNGAWQYAVMTPELREISLDEFVECNWVTGVSSPWVKSFKISALNDTESDKGLYSVTFTWTDSTNTTSESTQYITAKKVDDTWLVDSIQNLDLKGKITKVNTSGENLIDSVFVEGSGTRASYEQGTALLVDGTKIYQGDTFTELNADSLKTGTEVEVFFKPGPMIMIYPPQAAAAEIRIY